MMRGIVTWILLRLVDWLNPGFAAERDALVSQIKAYQQKAAADQTYLSQTDAKLTNWQELYKNELGNSERLEADIARLRNEAEASQRRIASERDNLRRLPDDAVLRAEL